jgi:hypothetical protein
LIKVVPLTFLNSYLSNGIVYEDEPDLVGVAKDSQEVISKVTQVYREALREVERIPNFIELKSHAPSKVAAVCVYLGRQKAGLENVWSPNLAFLTRTSEEEVRELAKVLKRHDSKSL